MFPATLDASRKKLRTVVSKGHRSENATTSSDKSEMSPYNCSAILYFLLCHQSSTNTKRDHSATSAEYQDPETGIALGVHTSHFLCQNVGATCYFRNPATIFLLVLFWENRHIMYVRQLVLTSRSRSGSLFCDDDSSIHGPSESKYTNRNINIEA